MSRFFRWSRAQVAGRAWWRAAEWVAIGSVAVAWTLRRGVMGWILAFVAGWCAAVAAFGQVMARERRRYRTYIHRQLGRVIAIRSEDDEWELDGSVWMRVDR